MTITPHKVVIIGSGFAGIAAAKRLKNAPVEITIISKTTYHLFQPLLYQVATGILSEGVVAPINRDLLRKQKNIRVVLGEVDQIDVEEKRVRSVLNGHSNFHSYDSLIIATGVTPSYFGNEHFGKYAPGLKTIDDALELRARIMNSFEFAEAEPNPELRKKYLTFSIVGGGPNGVELAGQIAEIAFSELRNAYDTIDADDIQVLLIHSGQYILPSFGEFAGKAAAKSLKKIGVGIKLNSRVTHIDDDSITYKDKNTGASYTIPSFCKSWSAGVAAQSLGKLIGEKTNTPLDKKGRVTVNPDLTVNGHPEIFVIGDLMNHENTPGLVQGAMQSGKYVGKNISRELKGASPAKRKPFKYFDKGNMAYVSRYNAFTQIGKIKFFGFFAWLIWLFIHVFYLSGVKNRYFALASWLVSFPTTKRAQLVSTEQQLQARIVLQHSPQP